MNQPPLILNAGDLVKRFRNDSPCGVRRRDFEKRVGSSPRYNPVVDDLSLSSRRAAKESYARRRMQIQPIETAAASKPQIARLAGSGTAFGGLGGGGCCCTTSMVFNCSSSVPDRR